MDTWTYASLETTLPTAASFHGSVGIIFSPQAGDPGSSTTVGGSNGAKDAWSYARLETTLPSAGELLMRVYVKFHLSNGVKDSWSNLMGRKIPGLI